MPIGREDRPAPEVIRDLYSAMEEAATQSENTIREALVDEGIDPDELVSDAKQLINRLSQQRRLENARQRMEFIRRLLRSSGSAIPSIEDIQDRLKGLSITPSDQQFRLAFYRKFESLTPKDRESLKNDELLLDFLIELEEEDNPAEKRS